MPGLTYYPSYAAAHEILGLSGNPKTMIITDSNNIIESIKITDHPDSYHRISANSAIIQYVGIGTLKSPGHPIGNQQYYRQDPFLNTWGAAKPICVLRQQSDGEVYLMGNYKVRGLRKRMGNEGFAYFHAELIRIW